jgi:ethanolamine ammonia-lyase large subunit
MGVIHLSEPKNKPNRKRDIFIRFMVDEKERDMIYKRMEQSGIKNLRAYLLKQAIDGQIIHIELDSVKEMVRLLSNATNNLNQIARRVNQTGSIYADDIADLQARYDEIWAQTKVILKKLAAM